MPTLRAAYAKSGLIRLVAHRDMGTHLRRMFLRAALPMTYSQGFSPKPRFHFAPPLPLGATCGEDWIDIDLDEPVPADEFLERVAPQALEGLTWVGAHLLEAKPEPLHALLLYGEWHFEPYDADASVPLIQEILAAATAETLPLTKRSKRGKIRELDVRSRVKVAEPVGTGFRVVLGASPNAAEGPLGLFDFLRATVPELEAHPMTHFKIERTRFLRSGPEGLLPAVEPGVAASR